MPACILQVIILQIVILSCDIHVVLGNMMVQGSTVEHN